MENSRVIQLESLRYKSELGDLLPLEFSSLPFSPRRVFTISNVPTQVSRGGHAHKVCEQILFCLNGEIVCDFVYPNGDKVSFKLNSDSPGIYVPSQIWGVQTYIVSHSVLLVIASHAWDSKDYINNMSDFLDGNND